MGSRGKIAGQRPSWVDLLDAYCHFALDQLKTAAKKGPKSDRDLAWLLWFDDVEHTHYKVMILSAAAETLRHCPDCYVAVEGLCEFGGVATGHSATTVPFTVAGVTLYPELLDIPGLPKAVADIAKKVTKDADEDSDEGAVANVKPMAEEFQTRGQLIRALLASDGNASAKPAADVQDCGEPSWCCLGRLVGNMSFVHVWRRMRFLDMSLGVPTEEFLKMASPMVDMHPYYHFLETHTQNPTAKRIAWEKLKLSEPDDLDFLEACMWLEYRQRHMPEADKLLVNAYRQHGDTHRDYYTLATNDPARRFWAWWAVVLCRDNPYSSAGPALAVMVGGENLKSRLPEWEKRAVAEPALAAAFAIRAINAQDWKNAEKWLNITAKTGDIEALARLAAVYCKQGKMDEWIATLRLAMKSPDAGLNHAMFNSYIARYYMRNGQWEKALPFAEEAASCGSIWGVEVLADYYEGTHDLANAEAIYKSIVERYPASAMGWYCFCRRTGQGDLAASASTATNVFGNRVAASCTALVYYLEKDMGKAKQILQLFANEGQPMFSLHLALLADDAKDAAGRDKLLDDIKKMKVNVPQSLFRPGQDSTCIVALAKLIADDLSKGGKGEVNLDAADKLNPQQPFYGDSTYNLRSSPGIAFHYLLGHYLDRHGKPDLAVRCWKRCAAMTENISDFYRTLAIVELLSRHIQPEG